MIVGVAGIGLIGGSFARDYKSAGHTVYVYDRTPAVAQYAMLAGVADGLLDENTIPQCDLILIALFPQDTIDSTNTAAHIVLTAAVSSFFNLIFRMCKFIY